MKTRNDLVEAYESILAHTSAFNPESEIEREALNQVLEFLESEISYINEMEETYVNE